MVAPCYIYLLGDSRKHWIKDFCARPLLSSGNITVFLAGSLCKEEAGRGGGGYMSLLVTTGFSAIDGFTSLVAGHSSQYKIGQICTPTNCQPSLFHGCIPLTVSRALHSVAADPQVATVHGVDYVEQTVVKVFLLFPEVVEKPLACQDGQKATTSEHVNGLPCSFHSLLSQPLPYVLPTCIYCTGGKH